jgi:endo-1,4-beta-xylanase
MYYTVKKLREKGVPIDVVGMQMHLLLKFSSPTAPQKDDVIATMQKFADLGVRIYITEFDVDLTKQPGTQTEKWDYEAQLYRDMLEACLESGVCDSFATWGISDSTSWITCMDAGCLVKEPNADPLMFDKEFNPKPAYFAFRDVLQNFSSQNAP